ncbi:MAG: ABC transporter permease, partial [Anaerolineales bacterium]
MIQKIKARNEMLYFALRNNKVRFGGLVVLFFVLLALVGPLLTDYEPWEYAGPSSQAPSAEFWFGTTTFGQDVFTQFV